MTPYSVSREAQRDLDEIYDYVANDNPFAADRLLRRFEENFLMLVRQPLIGELCEDVRANLRNVVVGSYVVYYMPEESGVRIVRVLHGARDVRRLF